MRGFFGFNPFVFRRIIKICLDLFHV